MHETIPMLLSAAAISGAAIFAVTVDRFRNPVTGIAVVIGGILPWPIIGVAFGSVSGFNGRIFELFMVVSLLGSGPLFFGALLRYWLGPRFPHWGKASCAMVAGILGAVGFFASVWSLFSRM